MSHKSLKKPATTYLACSDCLPLTCTRAGTCCHGKMVWLNPWELACMAAEKRLSARYFRDNYCELGGIRLRFNGASGWKGHSACSQYLPDAGCSVHAGRPLSCRLYPLGRERRGSEIRYMHRDTHFPCLDGCPEVASLPQLTVAEYCVGQMVDAGVAAQDAYIELMQHLADGAFALLLESGLAATGDRSTLRLWSRLGNGTPEQLTEYLGCEWIDRLMLPDINGGLDDPDCFAEEHYALLQAQTQKSFGRLEDVAALSNASGVMISLALHLGRGVGIDPLVLSKVWIATAKEHGALE